MSKLSLDPITTGYASVATINSNNDAVEAALENTLSRDGTGPNEMEANLDMNSNRILNLSAPATGSEPVRLVDIQESIDASDFGLPALTGNEHKALTTDGGTVAWQHIDSALGGKLSAAANKLPYFDGATSMTLADLTALARTLLALSTAAAIRTELDVPSNAQAVLDTLFAAKGDLLGATANDTPAIVSVGANGSVLLADSTQASGLVYAPLGQALISGLVQSRAADTDHDTTLSAGGAMDSTGVKYLALAAALTKRIDAAWAVGTNQGGLDGTESVGGTPDANTWYYIWLIARTDTGVVDALYSESASAPTMPTNYTLKRLVGAVKTDGSANIVAYTAHERAGGGLGVRWSAPSLDVDLAATLTTSRRTDTISVPTGFAVDAIIRPYVLDASSAHITLITCPDETDAAPSVTASPGANASDASGEGTTRQMIVRTSSTGTIAARSTLATVDTYRVFTVGFDWSRR